MTSQTPSGSARLGRTGLIVVLGLLSAFAPLSIDMYLPGLPAMAADLGSSVSGAQLTLTAYLVGMAAGQLVAGPMSDSRGRRAPLLVGLIAYTAASILCGLTSSVALLVLFRFFQGAAGGTGLVIARAIARDLYSGHQLARFFSYMMLVIGLAPILAPILGAQILRFGGWRTNFWVLGGFGLALLITVLLTLGETRPPELRPQGGLAGSLRTYGRLLRNPSFVSYMLVFGLGFGALFTYISTSPFVLEGLYRVSPTAFSLVFATNAIGLVAASQLSARLVVRFGPARLLAAAVAGEVTGAVILVAGALGGFGLLGVLVGLFIVVSSLGMANPNATALALSEQGQVAGSASALMGLAQAAVGAVAAPLAGLAGTATPLPMALIMLALTAAAAAGLAFAGAARRRHEYRLRREQ